MKKRANFRLIVGLVLLAFFIVISIIGPYVAPYDLDYSKKIDHIYTSDGERKLISSPFPPSKDHLFGTDKWGYDILTLMLYGAKYTIFTVLAVSLVRVIIGASTGILAAMGKREIASKPHKISLFSGIPTFIIIYFVMLGINIEPVFSTSSLLLIQGTLMVILGVPGVFNVVCNKTLEIKKNAYIEAARTLGGSKLHISIKHIFPAVKGNLLIIFLNECIQVMHIIGQLGIFNLFLGGTEKQYLPTIYLSMTHEWAGLIGQSRSFLYHSQWIIVFPLFAYLVLLFSLYFTSLGLNKYFKDNIRRTSYL